MGVAELGAQLFEVRQMKGISLAVVAHKAGISPAYLQKLEKGQVQGPSPHILRRLSNALELPYQQLMEAAGYLRPPDENRPDASENLLAVALKGERLTPEEATSLAKYLAFLRSQGSTT